jgi:hypothetical protein
VRRRSFGSIRRKIGSKRGVIGWTNKSSFCGWYGADIRIVGEMMLHEAGLEAIAVKLIHLFNLKEISFGLGE